MKRETLDDIYQSHMSDIYRYLLFLCRDHHLAEDVVQETFYRAYLYLEDCPEDRIRPWLLRVAYNAFIDLKRKHRRILLKEDGYFERLSGGATPEDEALRKEELQEIARVIESLPELQKQAVLLYDFQGLSYGQSAEIMGINPGHFKVLLFRARQRIRRLKREE